MIEYMDSNLKTSNYNKVMNWRDVYQLPLHSDTESVSYVWSNNEVMTFDFDFDYEYGEKRMMVDKIVEKLNGDSSIKFDSEFTIQNGIDFYYDGKYAFCIRGWGYLTGGGALHLSNDEAVSIQDDFAKWVLETLNN